MKRISDPRMHQFPRTETNSIVNSSKLGFIRSTGPQARGYCRNGAKHYFFDVAGARGKAK